MSWEVGLLALFAGLAGFWWDSLKKREIAILAARRVCERGRVQLLDATVALDRLRLKRDANQRARIYREFVFEFSDTGDNRQPGRVYLLGERVLDVTLVLAATPEAAEADTQIIHFPPR